jgi:hypothetical protein
MWIQDSAINLLSVIVTWCLGLALFLTMSEIVVELYARTEHANGLYYLMFGLHGLTNLVPWFWSSLVFMLVAFVMFLIPSVRTNYKLLPIACVLAFAGIWIEKGMGLIVPGFIPTPIGEVTEYYPTFIEVVMTVGNWAMGFFHPDHFAQGRHRHPDGRHPSTSGCAENRTTGRRHQRSKVRQHHEKNHIQRDDSGHWLAGWSSPAWPPAPAFGASAPAQPAPEVTCFESRKGASEVVKRDLKPGVPNVKCSPKTGAVLWWSDPFDGTVPMGDMPLLEKIPPLARRSSNHAPKSSP